MAEPSVRPTLCPRCSTPITGDFKFCPTCAFRLRNPQGASGGLPPTTARWPAALMALLLGLLVVAVALLGVMIFTPQFEDDGQTVIETPLPPRPPLTVRKHLAGLFSKTLFKGAATDLNPDPDPEAEPQLLWVDHSEMLIFEVTRGMYAEFLRDMEAQKDEADGLPTYLGFMENLWRPAPTGDAREDQRHIAYTDTYINVWWHLVQEHLKVRTASTDENGESVEVMVKRPTDLRAPLPPHYDVWLMVPPSWFYVTRFEELAWRMPPETDNLPVTEVSWYEARAFVQWVNDVLEMDCRLPTKWEWLRGGNGGNPDRLYPWGDAPYREACNNFNRWGPDDKPRPLRVDYRYSDDTGISLDGLYAMSGNARGWTLNSAVVQKNGLWVTEGVDEAEFGDAPTCGGSFRMGIQDCRVTTESVRDEEKLQRFDDLGFRLWRHVRGV